MIGDGSVGWKVVLRDALIVFFSSFLGVLAGFGYPPTWQGLFASSVAAGITALASARARLGVELPKVGG